MDLIKIYACFCDRTRLRILHLLGSGPLCVCHFQELLGEPQVKISKHLHYLKTHGLVTAKRDANWMIYALPLNPSALLRKNLACLHDCATEDLIFKKDADKLDKLERKFAKNHPVGCPSMVKEPRSLRLKDNSRVGRR